MDDARCWHLKAGDWIFRQGDPADAAYIVQDGAVDILAVRDGSETRLTTLTVGDLLGELGLVGDAPRSASARAKTDAVLAVLPRALILDRLEMADPLVRMLLNVILVRMRREMALAGGAAPPPPTVSPETAVADADAHAQTVDRMTLEGDLYRAVEGDEFRLHYQPIVRIADGTIAGFEALIRWNHPTRGPVRPDVFIGIAEETRLIFRLGKWVIAEAGRGLAALQETLEAARPDKPELFMSINVSGRQLEDRDLLSFLDASVASCGRNCGQFRLEITEGALVDAALALDWINASHDRGYKVALDDFGTGYSSLSYLSNFPVDAIKIDRSFILRMFADTRSMVLVRAIIGMADGLGVPAVAEGVEDADHATVLRSLGCTYGQGYHYGRPVPLEEAKDQVRRYRLGG